MKNKKISVALWCVLALTGISCSHTNYKHVVGNDKDAHGCLASAGYVWSEVKKDCVRLWEAGDKFVCGDESVYVIFSKDSVDIELVGKEGRHTLCRKKSGDRLWTSRKGKDRVYFEDGEMKVDFGGLTFSREYK